jgi:hypothetical protein
MKETIIQTNIIVKEYVPRLSMLLGEKVSLNLESGEGFEQIRTVLEKIDEEFRNMKKENVHLKERLQELLR